MKIEIKQYPTGFWKWNIKNEKPDKENYINKDFCVEGVKSIIPPLPNLGVKIRVFKPILET